MPGIQLATANDLETKASADHNHDDNYSPIGHSHNYEDIDNPPTIPSNGSQINYNNSNSGLSATDIQSAIDELKALFDSLQSPEE
ncbi:hypothetical protein [Oceanobacillus kimchii]|uniref:Uncharacterized protein n=1 Tax=Oceanobacillus kimchii TaxID=746691 RepID=A0ABQ5TNL4_9BACI|nr:hypothetical protein [Oceanobacillus kimchii]GLO66147.1 hypothetical protein MACH08_19310 [Oceanobacillus kimchii]